jgi:hypothetical protein
MNALNLLSKIGPIVHTTPVRPYHIKSLKQGNVIQTRSITSNVQNGFQSTLPMFSNSLLNNKSLKGTAILKNIPSFHTNVRHLFGGGPSKPGGGGKGKTI